MGATTRLKEENEMKVRYYTISFLTCLTFLVAATSVMALTEKEILDKIDAVISAPTDSTGTGTMILIDKKGKKKERRLKMWTRYYKDKDNLSLTKFLVPAEVRNLGFLSLSDEKMYLYLPAFDRIRRIASHARKESFAGSDMSNDDLSTGTYGDHFDAKKTQETDEEYVLELTRKPGSDRIYPKSTAWVNKQNFCITRMELFDENNKLWKTLTAKNNKIQEYWTMTEITMKDVQKNHQTIMKIEDIKFDVGLEDKIFSQRYLKRSIKE